MNKRKSKFKKTLRLVEKYLESPASVITNIYQADEYYDYPFFYQFISEYKPRKGWGEDDLLANGLSFNRDEALIKTVMETVERWNLSNYCEKDLVYDSFENLVRKERILNPLELRLVSKSQLKKKEYKKFNYDLNTKFYWTKICNLNKDGVLVPAQLIHFMHNKINNEPVIKLPDSTGAAAGVSFEQTLYSALCELIERDAYAIFYYNKLALKRLDSKTIRNKDLLRLIKRLEDYYFEVLIFDMTLDIEVPTFFCVLIDKTGIGPKISVGAKCSLDSDEAIEGSILEALQGIGATRDMLYVKNNLGQDFKKVGKSIRPILDRVMFWAEASKKDLGFLDEGLLVDYRNLKSNKEGNPKKKLEIVISILKESGVGEIYWKDTAGDEDKKQGVYTLKAFVPGLVPISLHINYNYFGNSRLFRVPVELGLKSKAVTEDELNKMPHPLP